MQELLIPYSSRQQCFIEDIQLISRLLRILCDTDFLKHVSIQSKIEVTSFFTALKLLGLLFCCCCCLWGSFWFHNLVCDEIFWVCLFSSVDNILSIRKSIHAWPADNRMVPGRGMSHLHCAELKKGFSKGHSTEEHLSVADVTGPVFVCWTACSSPYSVHILVAFWGVLSKVNSSSKHSSNVCMPFIKSFVNDSINKRRPMKQHALIVMIMILLWDLLLSVTESLPQLLVHYLLNPDDIVPVEDPTSISTIPMLPDCTLHLLFYGLILLIIRSKVKENGPLTHTVESQIRIGTLLPS